MGGRRKKVLAGRLNGRRAQVEVAASRRTEKRSNGGAIKISVLQRYGDAPL
jgi:hypothetical protein